MTAFTVLGERLGTGNSAGRLSCSLPLEWFGWNMKIHGLNFTACFFSWIGAVRLLSPWSAGETRRGWKQGGGGWSVGSWTSLVAIAVNWKGVLKRFLVGTLRHGCACCWKETAGQIIWAEFNHVTNLVKRATGKKTVGEAMSLETSGMFDLQYVSWAECTGLCVILQAKQF